MFPDKFSFNSDIYNLWEIYEAIKKIYPIGVPRGEGEGIFFEYSGIKKLNEIITENVLNEKNHKERWINYTNDLEEEIKKKVFEKTYGQAPSFCASVIMENNVIGNCTHLKELQFSISLIGNFFNIRA